MRFLENVRDGIQVLKNVINEIKRIMFMSLRTNGTAGRLDHSTLFALLSKYAYFSKEMKKYLRKRNL